MKRNINEGESSKRAKLSEGNPSTAGDEAGVVINTSSSIRAASRKNRVYVFRDFIRKLYTLPEGSVVLDVAGGKGDLSWLLQNFDNIDSVVVDPRITKANHILRSIKYLRDHPDQAKERSIPGLPTFQPLAALLPQLGNKDLNEFKNPRHLRLLVNEALVTAIQEYKKDQDIEKWKIYWSKATLEAQNVQPLGYKEELTDQASTILDAVEALNTILKASLILGFHPDQATDHAIDLAKVMNISYCVVPCCVFPRENTHRKTPEGKAVKHYPELIRYLSSTYDPQKASLPFHFTETARNIVLYSDLTDRYYHNET